MALLRIEIEGLRGFATRQIVDLAVPSGSDGSGMTVLVGPNSGGKSTVLEALRAASTRQNLSYTIGSRNIAAGDSVNIRWHTEAGSGTLRSVQPSSSETVREGDVLRLDRLLHLQSRRSFNPYFGQGTLTREKYMGGTSIPAFRAQPLDHFSSRLITIERGPLRAEFDSLVEQIAGRRLDWSIDQQDSGQYFVKVRSSDATHSSDGLGEGSVSVLFIADALYDSSAGDVVVIDEPELSLHPIHQRRLRRVLSEFASDRQIIIATHSPYFVDWSDLASGGLIHRVHQRSGSGSVVSTARPETIGQLAGLTSDIHNPHVLGLNATEVFFLEDGVILTEGQEDVVVYRSIVRDLGLAIKGEFFGWGVGGAEKMPLVLALLGDLGFCRVLGILDGDRAELADHLRGEYPSYRFEVIPAKDVRTKRARPASEGVEGLTDSHGLLRDEYRDAVERLFKSAADYLSLEGTTDPAAGSAEGVVP